MDLWYLLEAAFISQSMKDSNFLYNPMIIIIIFLYGFYKIIPISIWRSFDNYIGDFISNDYKNTSIIIPYHIKIYTGYGSKPTNKTLYSDRFHAITHHIKKYHMEKISSLTEIINFENSKYIDINISDFLLIPKNKQNILISEKHNIFLEVIYDIDQESKDEKDDSDKKICSIKKYIYKLFIPGLNNIKKINTFLSEIEKEYIEDKSIKTQMVFEFQKTVMDDCNKLTIEFRESPFHTNKSFDNIFFESKKEVLSYLEPFVNPNHKDHIINEKYGIPFKCVFMLHGPPGCGKSSLIKSTIKYTNRHCILVSWAKIKTCNDFVSLFRPIKINGKVYNQDELIIVFEDFDANDNDVLKIRKDMVPKINNDILEVNTNRCETVEKLGINDRIESIIKQQIVKNIDDISLEYILNVLDGIIELNNSIVFFTTNTLETIDPALTRVGRVDKVINMDYLNSNMFEEILNYYYPNECYKKYKSKINNIYNKQMSYSKIIQLVIESETIDTVFKNIHKNCKV